MLLFDFKILPLILVGFKLLESLTFFLTLNIFFACCHVILHFLGERVERRQSLLAKTQLITQLGTDFGLNLQIIQNVALDLLIDHLSLGSVFLFFTKIFVYQVASFFDFHRAGFELGANFDLRNKLLMSA
jgi:hypothetical protein